MCTDMALEAVELNDFSKKMGVSVKDIDGLVIRSRVDIRTDAQSKAINKRIGLYYTFDVKEDLINEKLKNSLINAIKEALIEMAALNIKRKPIVLAVGLGNRNITADALGAEVIDRLIITRPYFENSDKKAKDLTNLCAITPSVYGLTGIESLDIIKGVINEIKPDIVIAVDSLAAAKASRLYSSFQITTAGIEPGSGVDNRRLALNRETLSVPVISIGVPLALYARSLLREGLLQYAIQNGEGLDGNRLALTLKNTLTARNMNMVVTPKAIDGIVENCADIIASAINLTFQHTAVKTDKYKI